MAEKKNKRSVKNSNNTEHEQFDDSSEIADIETSEASVAQDTASTKSNVNRSGAQRITQADEGDLKLPQVISEKIPPESRESVERLYRDGRRALTESRSYARENPGEAISLIVAAGAVLWALVGTKPGRRVLETGTSVATPLITQWLTRNIKVSFA